MATATRNLLSEMITLTKYGRNIKVAATGDPGTLIHTAIASTSIIDEVWLYAINSDVAVRKVTVEWGSNTSPDDYIEQFVPPESGAILIVPGFQINNSQAIRVFADAANVVMINGYVNRIG